MKKIDMTIEAVVLVPVKVKLDVTVRADDDASTKKIVKALAAGEYNKKRFDIEDVSVVTAEFHGLLDEDDSLEDQIQEYIGQQPKLEILSAEADDSR